MVVHKKILKKGANTTRKDKYSFIKEYVNERLVSFRPKIATRMLEEIKTNITGRLNNVRL